VACDCLRLWFPNCSFFPAAVGEGSGGSEPLQVRRLSIVQLPLRLSALRNAGPRNILALPRDNLIEDEILQKRRRRRNLFAAQVSRSRTFGLGDFKGLVPVGICLHCRIFEAEQTLVVFRLLNRRACCDIQRAVDVCHSEFPPNLPTFGRGAERRNRHSSHLGDDAGQPFTIAELYQFFFPRR
jgi:hypothetical protein